MSAPNELSPGPGSPLRTSVPLATRTPARASVTPSNMPPRLSAKMTTPKPPTASMAPPPVSAGVSISETPMMSAPIFGEGMMAYRENALNYALQVGLQAIPAIAMGLIIDKVLKKLQDKFDLGPLVMILIQLIVVVVILFIVERYIATNYADAWQQTTPGLFFLIFLFGTQFNLFENIKKLRDQVFDDKGSSPSRV